MIFKLSFIRLLGQSFYNCLLSIYEVPDTVMEAEKMALNKGLIFGKLTYCGISNSMRLCLIEFFRGKGIPRESVKIIKWV